MTCIAAVVEDGRVYMGGDSAAVAGYHLDLQKVSKVWTSGGIVFGACGSFRVMQVVRYHTSVPSSANQTPLEYVTGSLVDAIRTSLSERGSLTTWHEDSTESLTQSGLMVGVGGRLFEIYDDFGVFEPQSSFAAIGCGSPYAMGALAVLSCKPKARVLRALKVAERYSAGVRGPFHVEVV